MASWVSWQLADSAFPGGGFAHSAGLESAVGWGEVAGGEGLVEFLRTSLTQAGHSYVPLLVAAHRQPSRLDRLDRLCDAFLSNHVANRASRRQGQALVASAEAAFAAGSLSRLRASVKAGGLAGHFPIMFGAVTSLLGVKEDEAVRLFLYITLRGLVSAAVRLGVVGPLEGQAIQHRLGPFTRQLARRCGKYHVEQIAQTAPLIDILQATHDRLYCRLFQS